MWETFVAEHNLTYADKYTCLEHLELPLLSTTQPLCLCEVVFSSTPTLLVFPRASSLLCYCGSKATVTAELSLTGHFVTLYYNRLFACLSLPLWHRLLEDRRCVCLIYCYSPSVCLGIFAKQMNE